MDLPAFLLRRLSYPSKPSLYSHLQDISIPAHPTPPPFHLTTSKVRTWFWGLAPEHTMVGNSPSFSQQQSTANNIYTLVRSCWK